MTTMVLSLVAVDAITEHIDARSLHPSGVKALTKKMEVLGYLPQFPVLVTTADGSTYRLLDGAHRVAAAKAAQLTEVHALVREPCADLLEEIHLARMSNEASGTNVGTTLVDDAELVWRLREAGYTQEQVGAALSWERVEVAQYQALQKISGEAWDVVVKTFEPQVDEMKAVDFTEDVKFFTSPFTRYILSHILDLTPTQQLELCSSLASGVWNKNKFTTMAKAYKARNAAWAWVQHQLGGMDEVFVVEAEQAVASGQYDTEWQEANGPGKKLQKLVESLRERWEKKYSIRLMHGDFYTLIAQVGDASIDAVIVDPPYNISVDRIYTLATQPDWNKNFGDWDNKENADFCRDLATWAKEYYRVMKPGTTGFMFVGEPYLNISQAIFDDAGFELKGTFYWCRTNPGPSVTKADFMPAMDMAIQFVKDGAKRTFHYPGDADGDGFNWRRFPLCAGDERLKNAKKETLHPTQKPEAVIRHLMELITVPGDTVLDGFMGTGTTASVAKKLGRKFVGFENDPTYFAAAQRRMES